MSVTPNIRLAPVPGEAAVAATAEPGNLAELFAQIISCLGAPTHESEPGEISPGLPKEPETALLAEREAQPPQSPLEAIQQLLAVVGVAVPPSVKSEDGEAASADSPPQDARPEPAAAPLLAAALPAIAQSPVAVPVPGGAEPPPTAAPVKCELPPQRPIEQDIAAPMIPPAVQQVAQSTEKQPQVATAAPAEIPVKTAPTPQLPTRPSAKAIVEAAAEQIENRTRAPLDIAMRAMLAASAAPHLPPAAPVRKVQTGSNINSAEPAAAVPAALLRIAPTLFITDAPASPNLELAPSQPALQAESSEFVVERQLDLAHEGEWLDQLTRDITEAAAGEGRALRFRLNPETLGSLRVEIAQDRHGAAIRLTADTEAARAVIAEAQPRLLAEARAQGLRISEAHVDLGGQNGSGDPRRPQSDFEEAHLRTARSLQKEAQNEAEGDGKPTPRKSERYA